MPHQLRRIVGINIRNPKEGQPSARISVMDPRGGVLAVGENGAGKTTFLRLLPLFYGATPQQILRGSGRSKMVAYTLPDPSSAVAFEYERESSQDLRTVVMHCKAHEDAPEFHIVSSEFREEFFFDENNQFVLREDFKARIEAMRCGADGTQRIEVTPKLALHQYRSVILNERLQTKDGKEMRRLAARHSLGPKSLYNLDQMAAAMANEKISFRDLQSIVIDRIADAQTDGLASANSRSLKKNRKDVTSWLEDYAHTAEVLKATPAAVQMSKRGKRIQELHLQTCALHVAVKDAFAQVGRELLDLDREEHVLKETFDQEGGRLDGEIEEQEGALAQARGVWSEEVQWVDEAEGKVHSFESKGSAALAAEQDAEGAISSQLRAKEIELAPLEAAAGSIGTTHEQRIKAIEDAYRSRLAEVHDQELDAVRHQAAQRDELEEAERDAVDSLESPARLGEIANEQIAIAGRQGELRALLANPVATETTLAEAREASEALERLTTEFSNARQKVVETAEVARTKKSLVDESLRHMDALERSAEEFAAKIRALEAQLTPSPGTLLERLRQADAASWAQVAKVLDPALLGRADLSPVIDESADDAAVVQAGRVSVGALSLNVADVATPAWVDLQDLREQMQAQRGNAASNARALDVAKAAAARLVSEHAQAEASANAANARVSLSQTAHSNAKKKHDRYVAAVARERQDARTSAERELKALSSQVIILTGEAARLQASQSLARDRLRNDFKSQRTRLADEHARAMKRMEGERVDAAQAKEAQVQQATADRDAELRGKGVDPVRVAQIVSSIAGLRMRLSAIAANRHNVDAWRQFQREVLPYMEVHRQERDRRKVLLDAASTRLSTLMADRDGLNKDTQLRAGRIQSLRATRNGEQTRLSALLASGLKDFLTLVSGKVDVDWGVEELERAVARARSDLTVESDALHRETRSLNDLMRRRSGPIADWVDLRERDLPDEQTRLEHEYRCLKAQVLCDWFDPMAHRFHLNAIHKDMHGFLAVAATFVRDIDLFERQVAAFNRDLQAALKDTARFERFRDLSVTVSSGVGSLEALKTFRLMKDVSDSKSTSYRSIVMAESELPTQEEVQLIKAFREHLPADGELRVNLNDQVRLECSLFENGRRQTITNEEEFKAVSSNGNTALITAMFLMGFVQMIRGPLSPVRLTWVTDEVGRFDPNNLKAFLQTLDAHQIDVISASPSVDPALARYFPRLCLFEPNGAIVTMDNVGSYTPIGRPRNPHEEKARGTT